MDWLTNQHRTQPGAPALHDEQRTWSYNELHNRVASIAGSISQEHAFTRDDIIAIFLPNSAEFVMLLHAVRWIGATAFPMHVQSTAPELRRTVDSIHPSVIVTDKEHIDIVRDALENRATSALLIEHLTSSDAPSIEQPAPAPATATILQTSGSTGNPKFVPHSFQQHEASAFASSYNIPVTPDDNWLCVLPLSHAGGISIIFRSMIYGCSMTILQEFHPEIVIETINKRHVTHISLVPTMLRRLLQLDEFSPEHLPSLKVILLGGAAADPASLKEGLERGLPIRTSYGMTETASQIATMPDYAPQDKLLSAGQPLPGMSIRIAGGDGEELDRGCIGTIWVKGKPVLTSYYNQDPVSEAFRDGWFRTGDTGMLDGDGYVWVSGRGGSTIITGGENVDTAEIEAVLRQCPGVSDAVVLGLPDQEWGEVVAAAIEIPRDIDIRDIKAFCSVRLAPFKIPKRWLTLKELPRTSSGKISRPALRNYEFVPLAE